MTQKRQEKLNNIIKEIEIFCENNLNENFKEKAIELANILSTQNTQPLSKGREKTWASAILDTIMKKNFIYDSSNPLHIMKKDFIKIIGVSQSTINKKSNEIMEMLDISILSKEWIVKGNEEFSMYSFIKNVENDLMLDEDIVGTLVDIESENNDLKAIIMQKIINDNLDKLDIDELKILIMACIDMSTGLLLELKKEFKEDEYYETRVKQIEFVLNKANDASMKIKEKNGNIYAHLLVQNVMAEVYANSFDFKNALECYEYIAKFAKNDEFDTSYKIFNLKLVTDDNVKEYMDMNSKKDNAMWDYSRVLYFYSQKNELMATKYLKEAIKKNRVISDILLEEYEMDERKELSTIEQDALAYSYCSGWLWQSIEGVLEWLFYARQKYLV